MIYYRKVKVIVEQFTGDNAYVIEAMNSAYKISKDSDIRYSLEINGTVSNALFVGDYVVIDPVLGRMILDEKDFAVYKHKNDLWLDLSAAAQKGL